ncbi:MAG: 6-carboxytetrahydropterin synthase QueD [Deltaproteobacteria bacterium]|nr:6-carboxytetrahydropterin synthase QueD [Deltaproteobacteria bacterium]
MFELKIVTNFSAAHQLREFHGACEQLHGHNWKLEVYITGENLNKAGVVLDFKILKGYVKEILDTLDHKFLNELPTFKDHNPSSENIARYVAQELAQRLEDPKIKISRVTAWESDNACATYYP